MHFQEVVRTAHVVFMFATAYFLLLSVSNIVWLRFGTRKPTVTTGKRVSVLVPCRDEEPNVARCLESLLIQTYSNYEIVVLDDQSSDQTWEILCEYSRRHPNLIRAVRGNPPPAGWCGKTYAMQQLSEHSTGDYLLFTDADTVHSTKSLAWAVTNIESHGADHLSGYVSQQIASLGELVIVPVMYIMSAIIMPLWLIPRSRTPALSFATGHLVMFRREAFVAVGGYRRVCDRISEDVFMAQEVKRAGFRVIFLDLREQVRCRMYAGYRAAFSGISKNIYDSPAKRWRILTVSMMCYAAANVAE